jgi:hypothetical protein
MSVVEDLGRPSVASRWTATDLGLEISLATAGRDDHDIAWELLLCLGQALWEKLSYSQRKAYWLLLDDEISAGTPGEIDEDALKQKRLLLSNRNIAGSSSRLERYGSASFAGMAAEYVHCLWHDVTVRTGPAFLPAVGHFDAVWSCWRAGTQRVEGIDFFHGETGRGSRAPTR